jgi:hypothetical protein
MNTSTTSCPVITVHATDILFGHIYRPGGIGHTHPGNADCCTFIELFQWQYCVCGQRKKDEIAASLLTHFVTIIVDCYN